MYHVLQFSSTELCKHLSTKVQTATALEITINSHYLFYR